MSNLPAQIPPTVDRLQEFNQYYNHTIHPELVRLERQRKRFIRLLLISAVLLAGVVTFEIVIDELLLTLAMMIPIGLYVVYLLYRFRHFRQQFKPQVVNLILDFLDDGPNYGELSYMPEKNIPTGAFVGSKLFDLPTNPQDYSYDGEDYIEGKIGTMNFGMSELRVKKKSQVRNRLNYVFSGVFLVSELTGKHKGAVLLWPREFKQYLTRELKLIDREGGKAVAGMLQVKGFNERFIVRATRESAVRKLLNDEIQKSILEYRNQTDKPIYLSIIGNQVFVAITEHRDLLEPSLWQSNLSYDLVREFFADINASLELVRRLDGFLV